MTHVAIRTSHFDESIDFYRRYAGLHVVHERTDGSTRVAWLSHRREDPEFVIVVLEMPHQRAADPPPMDHFGFDVGSRDEIDGIAALARREGKLRLGPVDAGPIVGYIAMVEDPSGNTCEFSHGQPINPGK